ncbi:MAG: hypothetical protein Q4E33_05365 [Erysipelotrichaceae bacterium]|nr:hypothetical protein [Erysipelotrichaceae bacterium]
MKTKEELQTLKQEYETIASKLQELSVSELDQITGGELASFAYLEKEWDAIALRNCSFKGEVTNRSDDKEHVGNY